MRANPERTFHQKQGTQADLAARARPITDAEERRDVLTRIVGRLGRADLDDWLARSPLVEVAFL